ncbi:MAG: vitamin K epoxide reductase family protein [Chloroflexi bacterium]|nr:vitamin K epoxide reductase family protein [Chloroflexota bacterium]
MAPAVERGEGISRKGPPAAALSSTVGGGTPVTVVGWLGGSLLRRVILILALAGFLVAGYLTWVHYDSSSGPLLCSGVGGCETVNNSPYAMINGIPVALFGAAMYLLLILLSLGRDTVDEISPIPASLLTFSIALMGVLYSVYLTYLEVYVIHAICPYCISSALIITALCVLSGVELWQNMKFANS